MNSKHRKTLQAIFATPTPKTMPWADIEALLIAVGAVLTEGNGSRVKFDACGVTVFFHRPHPGKEAMPYQVKEARRFLEEIGATTWI